MAILLPATVALAAALGSKPSVAVVAAASAALFLLALARMAGLVRDVEAKVEEVRAQGLRLTEAEVKYRTLVEQLPAVTYVGGLEPQKGAVRLAFISPQVEELLGYSPAEWIARPDLSLSGTGDACPWRCRAGSSPTKGSRSAFSASPGT